MNEMQVFENPEFGKIRGIEIDNEPWFIGKDIAEALGYQNTKDALASHVDEDDKRILQRSEIATLENHIQKEVLPIEFVHSDVPNRGLTIINESGLYSLIMSSKLPTAKQFKRWVTSEVLPSIRKHGGYIAGQEELTDDELLEKAVLVANRKIAEREARIAELTAKNQIMEPKAEYFDELVERNLLTNFRTTAKEFGMKEKAFIAFLMEKGYIYRDKKGHLQPKAEKNSGLFEVKEFVNTATQYTSTQTLITPKGRETFRLLCRGLGE